MAETMKMKKITTRKAWTTEDNIAIVDLYNTMLALQDSGTKYVKAPLVRAVAEKLGRSKGSIECKLMNISYVKQVNGLAIVHGYKSLSNVNKDLYNFVLRHEVA